MKFEVALTLKGRTPGAVNKTCLHPSRVRDVLIADRGISLPLVAQPPANFWNAFSVLVFSAAAHRAALQFFFLPIPISSSIAPTISTPECVWIV